MGYLKAMFVCLVLLTSSAAWADGILIIGDSISNGYTPYVQQALPCVVHSPGNAHETGHILKKLHRWLAGKRYDIIYFNAGLWDIAHRAKGGKLRDVTFGQRTTDETAYLANMYAIIDRLKATGATVIVATTTDVPQGSLGRDPRDVVTYNKLLKTAAQNKGIPIDDLYALMLPYARLHDLSDEIKVHYTPEGYQVLAKSVVSVLKQYGGCRTKAAAGVK